MTYTFDLTKVKDREDLQDFLYLMESFWNTKKFRKFVGDKCLDELFKLNHTIPDYTLLEHSVFQGKVEEYKRNHQVEYGDDYILLFNDTVLPLEEMWWLGESSRPNYPNGISVALIIEYGTGLLGTPAEGWEVNINNHQQDPNSTTYSLTQPHDYSWAWKYLSPDHRGVKGVDPANYTNGLEGQLIYFKFFSKVRERFGDWVIEYAERMVRQWK